MSLVDGTVRVLCVPVVNFGLPKATAGILRIPLADLLLVIIVIRGNVKTLPLRFSLENNNVLCRSRKITKSSQESHEGSVIPGEASGSTLPLTFESFLSSKSHDVAE